MASVPVRILACCLAVSLSACSSFQPVPDWRARFDDPPPASTQGIGPGDRLRVSTAGQAPVELVVTGVEAGVLLGQQVGTDEMLRIPLSDITAVEQSTATVVAYAAVLLGTLAFWALVFAIIDSIVAAGL